MIWAGGNTQENITVRNYLVYHGNVALNVDWDPNLLLGINHDYTYWDSTCTNPPLYPPETHGQTETISKYELFVDPDHYDYHLKTADTHIVGKGISQGAPYDLDKNGVSRSSSWDIGAYEYVQAGDTFPPAAPTGLAIK
jgi:hypothetical protein